MGRIYTPVMFKRPRNKDKQPIKLTSTTIRDMAFGLMRYLYDREMFGDTRIYYKPKDIWLAIQGYKPSDQKLHWKEVQHTYRNRTYKLYLITDIDPKDYFEYNGNYLSVSFEGALYHVLNYGETYMPEQRHAYDEMQNFFSHYGLYFEMGYAWSLSVYEE